MKQIVNSIFLFLFFFNIGFYYFSEGDRRDFSEVLNLPAVVETLTQYLLHNSVQTKVAVLQWIHHLHICLPNQVCYFYNKNNFWYW